MDATLQDPLVGRLLDDRYLVLELVARGGMATVYHALDRRLDRAVALKVLHSHLAGDAAFAARFDREARAAARLSHPNVVGVFDQGQDGDLHYLAMEYLPGRTLRQVLVERGALTPKEALRVMDPVLDALAAAHRAGIVHRDVKPENVILTDDGRVKVADFGLARAAASTNATTGVLLGTVAYLAPELVTEGTADARSDVYSAGIVLFEVLTGRQPFVGELPAQVAYRHVHEDVPTPSDIAPNVPEALDDVVLAATARTPDERPADAAAFLAMLRSARRRIPAELMDERADVPYAPGAVAAAMNDPFDGLAATQAVDQAVENRTRALPGLAASALGNGAGGAPGHDALGNGHSPTGMQPPPRSRRSRLVAGLPVNEDEIGPPVDDAALARLAEARRRRGLVVMALVVVTAVVLVIGSYWFIAGPGAQVVVPSTATLTQAEATKQLADIPLGVKVVTAFSDDVKKGIVIESRPEAGAAVRKNSTVTLTVSKGPELFDVPDVTGKPKDQADQDLQGEGFALGKVSEKFDNDVDAGLVISQSPVADAKRAKGTKVDLVISKGKELVAIPDVLRQDENTARNTLRSAGFVVEVGDPRFDPSVPQGQVVAQEPGGNTKAAPDSTVTIFLSNGPDPEQTVEVPDVRGRDVDKARERLQEEGLQVNVVEQPNKFFNRVGNQNPAPGTPVARGTVVTIFIF
ncbi:Stk1 family PASTA domain-containing Ser/Thr kinase [Kineosporia sp. A_224]|uniref:Stk1 family PASTA domain-containing Ser/Thr kinase n=1 Tax=Kineosporia sp. A_224 TaxID=1962180 RepID=UPI000B4B93F8|nr:Stk1 family PASTA domain-containing Ser/Thr kinase [Kineosporia sp. A_224]